MLFLYIHPKFYFLKWKYRGRNFKMKKLFYIGAMSVLLLSACNVEKTEVETKAHEELDKAKEKEEEQAKKEANKKAKEEEKQTKKEEKAAKKEEERRAKEEEKKSKEEAKKKAEKEEKPKSVAEDKAKSKDSKEDLKKMVSDIVSTDLNGTKINDLIVNNYQAEENKYIVLPHLKWDTKNSKKRTIEMLEMYSDHIAAKLYEQKGIEEITVFWEVPYYLKGDNIAKFNYTRTLKGMSKNDTWLAPVLQ